MTLRFEVFGRCAPQGSKRYVGGSKAQGGRFIEASKYLPAWRKIVTEAAIYLIYEQNWQMVEMPVSLKVDFYLERPSTIPFSKRPCPIKAPDLDKLVRAVCDSLTDAKAWTDDALVVELVASKKYADQRKPGAEISISTIDFDGPKPEDNELSTISG